MSQLVKRWLDGLAMTGNFNPGHGERRRTMAFKDKCPVIEPFQIEVEDLSRDE